MIGRIAEFWSILRELDVGRIRSDLESPLAVVLCGPYGSGRHTLACSLFGHGFAELGVAIAERCPSLVESDALITVLRADSGTDPSRESEPDPVGPRLAVMTHADLAPRLPSELRGDGVTPTVWVDARDAIAVQTEVAPALVRIAPHLALPLARRVPSLRPLVAERLIRETSRVNLEFALISNIPSLIPIAGSVVGGAADMIVLTKNQVLLVFKLAGIYGRDLSDLRALLAEIAPVVGSAFLWRSLARIAAGMLPAPAALIPKTSIAFVGTYLVGEMARYYYEHGAPPPQELVARFRAEGGRVFGALAQRLGRDALASHDCW